MHGNVWEWTADWWGCSFPTADGSWCSVLGSKRSFRGGGWDSTPNDIRAINRNNFHQQRDEMMLDFDYAKFRK